MRIVQAGEIACRVVDGLVADTSPARAGSPATVGKWLTTLHHLQAPRRAGRCHHCTESSATILEKLTMCSADAAIDWIVDMSATIPGWRHGPEAKALAMAAHGLGPNPTIVEVGVFMGRSTLLLAGARRLHGNGRVHCIDPFDCSGDAFSVPHYRAILRQLGAASLEDVFRSQMRRFRLERTIEVHKGASREIAAGWTAPIDLLLLDADHSPEGAREAFDDWMPFVKPGGMVVLDNTADREYAPTHDGNYRLSKERLKPPRFTNIHRVEGTTFATFATP